MAAIGHIVPVGVGMVAERVIVGHLGDDGFESFLLFLCSWLGIRLWLLLEWEASVKFGKFFVRNVFVRTKIAGSFLGNRAEASGVV